MILVERYLAWLESKSLITAAAAKEKRPRAIALRVLLRKGHGVGNRLAAQIRDEREADAAAAAAAAAP